MPSLWKYFNRRTEFDEKNIFAIFYINIFAQLIYENRRVKEAEKNFNIQNNSSFKFVAVLLAQIATLFSNEIIPFCMYFVYRDLPPCRFFSFALRDILDEESRSLGNKYKRSQLLS